MKEHRMNEQTVRAGLVQAENCLGMMFDQDGNVICNEKFIRKQIETVRSFLRFAEEGLKDV